MFNFSFSIWGTFAFIILFLSSFFVNWVFKVNFKNRVKEKTSGYKNNAVKFTKEYLDINHVKANFQVKKNHYYTNLISQNNIYIDNDSYYVSSIYHVEQELFKTILFIKHNNWWNRNQLLLKCILFILALSLSIFLIMSFLLGVIITSSIIMIMMFADMMLSFRLTSKVIKQESWILQKLGFNKSIINKVLHYKKLWFLDKYISVFSEGVIGLVMLFKKWGHNE